MVQCICLWFSLGNAGQKFLKNCSNRKEFSERKVECISIIFECYTPFLSWKGSFVFLRRHYNGKRIGIVGIVVEDLASVEKVNDTLHEFASLVIGRMGLPYKEKEVSVISLIVDGTNDEISSLTGKLGRISGVAVKSMVTKA